jgi:hypothetical protein
MLSVRASAAVLFQVVRTGTEFEVFIVAALELTLVPAVANLYLIAPYPTLSELKSNPSVLLSEKSTFKTPFLTANLKR